VVKINFSNFVLTKSKYPVSKELSRYLDRILYKSNRLTKLHTENSTFDEYLRQIPIQSSRFDGFFLKANLKLVIRIALLLLLSFTPRKLEKHKSISLIHGLSYEQIHFAESTTRIEEFLFSKKIGLAKNDLFYIENYRHSIVSKKFQRIRICRNIPTSLFHDFLNFGDKLQIVFFVTQRMLKYLVTQINYPIVHHIAQAYVVDEVIFDYLIKNRKIKLIDLVATPSMLTHLPYIFDRNLQFGKRLMIWYSANAVPINYRDKNLVRTHFNEKNFEFMPLDLHYVWNQPHKDYLDSVTNPLIPVEVRGSLMFYLPQNEKSLTKVYDIVIFDVTPYELSRKSDFDQIPIGQNSIYNSYFAIKFLQDLLWVVHEIDRCFDTELRIALKPKRKYTPLHSKEYLAFLENLSKNGLIDILESESDLYKTISESRICISYPFSSPAVIAKELDIPTAYFLAGNSIESNSLVDGIPFIADRTKLLDFIVKYRIMEQ
jgi:polysaccharide biosynthesis PFTS motif protein